jgi:hypothetical protein
VINALVEQKVNETKAYNESCSAAGFTRARQASGSLEGWQTRGGRQVRFKLKDY